MASRIAYLINQYPKISHAFIQREIQALERQDFDVLRIAVRGWDSDLIDTDSHHERARTRYILQGGLPMLLLATFRALLTKPLRFACALVLAIRMGRHADRSLPYHLAYLAEACRILPWLLSFGTTHIHAHFGSNSAEVVMLAHALGGPPYSFTVHGPYEFDKPEFLGMAEKMRRAAFIVAVSSFGRGQLYRWVEHAHWHKIKVVHGGLESAFFDVEPTAPPATPRLVCVGRLCAEKGQLLLIEAARRLAEKEVTFELVLVGDGELRGELEALIAKHGLGQKVHVTGSVTTMRLRDEILRARALVLPSLAEGLPMVIMEAMALRRPVLTTYVAGIPELVRPGENGWLFAAGSIDELISAIEDCLSRTPADLRVMGEAAHARAVERHSIDVEAAKLANLFRRLA